MPRTYFEAFLMVQNFTALVSLCFGLDSNIAMSVSTWLDHMSFNSLVYEARQNDDLIFLLKSYSFLMLLCKYTFNLVKVHVIGMA